jgi:hypothetical protein
MAACADKNGVIQDPRACTFDPASIRCTETERPNCLTDEQVKMVWDEYRGPYNAQGRADMHQRLEQLGGVYNPDDPDLEAFRAHGGKLIIYHSWADQAIPPFATLDYYRAVANQMGG